MQQQLWYNDILTVGEACEALKVDYNAMYELLNASKLKGYRNGLVWRIPKMALVGYIQNSLRLKWQRRRELSLRLIIIVLLWKSSPASKRHVQIMVARGTHVTPEDKGKMWQLYQSKNAEKLERISNTVSRYVPEYEAVVSEAIIGL